MIIAIDGPAGAGKSTVAKIIAQRMGFIYIDTGAMYRALTLKALEQGIDVNQAERVVELAVGTRIELYNDASGNLTVLLDGKDVSAQIRQPRITRFVSDVAKIPGVREVMLGLQRALAKTGNVVLDGRDIGTVVFPGADKKFYIDAAFKERVRRRYNELKEAGEAVTLGNIEADLANRDTIDSTRECAPLKKADDAIYIDTTEMNIEEVAAKIKTWINL
ncbi:MAG: (d)CMP kinase [Candidatus Omnitrophica bacterium]|nr:(d)CMP kinase [Candidatus Omnitrophota bacterium]